MVAGLPDASVRAAQDCLLVIWDAQDAPADRREFDVVHDEVEGGAISCATGTSASEFEQALVAIRAAAAANDKAALMRELSVPLLYIDSDGNRRDVLADELVEAGFDAVFSPDVLAMMQDLQLADMTVVPDQGAFFRLGAIWLVADRQGGRPRLVTVNSQAFREAEEAASKVATRERRPALDGR
ncbi:hypothetical protein GRI62_03980 [Erythrobacter arachoides]|uniref:Uncharacterized protein n=1 Tax=Aurantiacibacter arachoides TaxID=1850444 RepID=A0A845A1D7_9SPHN|nr:hypothetical protein [Aurantiacibacter arachoides]